MAHMPGDAAREVERLLGDRKGVARIEADAEAAYLLAESDQLIAPEILVVLDREHAACIGSARPELSERSTYARHEFRPIGPERMPIAAQHPRQAEADGLG